MKRFIYTVKKLPGDYERVYLYRISNNEVHLVGCMETRYKEPGAEAVTLAVDNNLIRPTHRLTLPSGSYKKTPVSWENEGIAKFTEV